MSAKVLRKYALTIATVDYAADTSQVAFAPPQAVEWQGGAGNIEVDYDPSNCQVTIGYADDDTAASFVRMLADVNVWGTKVPCVWTPNAGGPTYTSTLTLGPGQIGGSVGGFRANTVTLRGTWPTITES